MEVSIPLIRFPSFLLNNHHRKGQVQKHVSIPLIRFPSFLPSTVSRWWRAVRRVNTFNQVSFISTRSTFLALFKNLICVNTFNQVSFISTVPFQSPLKSRGLALIFAGNYQNILKSCILHPFFCLFTIALIIIQSFPLTQITLLISILSLSPYIFNSKM